MSLPDLALPPLAHNAWRHLPEGWRRSLLHLGVGWLFLIALFAADWAEMAHQWLTSSTYNHMIFILPICAWLVEMRRRELARLVPVAWWPGLILLAGALLLWLAGVVSQVNTARQLGAVVAMQAAVLALLGPRVAAGLAFPLAYLLFAIPFGEEIVPQMQMVTAHIVIALVEASQIPAQIDGVFIHTPAGLFEVAEACSGVKFLVAMAALGALMAHLCFKDWRRRAAFMAAALAVPILANGIRAWATIAMAQLVGAETATGIDHIIYGWFFFALVMALLGLAARPFFDRPAGDSPIDADALRASRLLGRAEHLAIAGRAALLSVLALAGGVAFWASASIRPVESLSGAIQLPQVAGWSVVKPQANPAWQPLASGAGKRVLARYVDDSGRALDLFMAVYPGGAGRADPGDYGEGALPPDSAWAWLGKGPEFADARSEYLLAHGADKRLAVTYYRSGRLITGSPVRLKLATLVDRLLLRPQSVGVFILSAEDSGKGDASGSIRAFLDAAGPADAWMDAVMKRP